MKKKIFKQILIISFFVILYSGFIFSGDCTIDWGITYQTISGFGGSSAWSEWTGCPCGTNTFLVNNIQQFFSATNGIGLSIIRARIPPEQSQWASTVPPLQAAKNQGALVMATVWTPPAVWKSNGRVDNSDGGYLLPQYYSDYANYLVNYVNMLKNNYSINLYAISPANEPDYQVSYDGCSWTGAQLRDFIKNNLGPAFATANITTKILVPESFRNDCTYASTILNDATARNYVFGIAQHIYGGGPTFCSAVGTYNKEFWQTEISSFENYDATMTHGLTTAQWIHNSLVNANYNAFLYWWLASDANNEGLRSVNNGVPKRFWVMGNYSKFVRPGFIRISANANPTAGIYVSAYKNSATGDFAIVAINTNSSVTNQKFILNSMSVSSVTPYLTDASNDLTQQSSVSVASGSFTYNLPARSVITFIGISGAVIGTPTYTFTITPTPTLVSSEMLDDFEDCNGTNNRGGVWYTYRDNNSTLNPNPFSTTSGGITGSTICSVLVTGNIASGGYGGLGTNLNSSGTEVDLTNYAGIEFYVRGNGGTYWIQFTQPSITDGDFFGVNFSAPSNWTKVQVFFETSGLHQRGWGIPSTFTQNAVIAIQWTNYTTGAVNFQIDDVKLILKNPSIPTQTQTRTGTPTFTRTNTPTNTWTFTRTNTPTNTITFTNTATNTRTFTVTLSLTWTSTNTYTATVTESPTNTGSLTATQTNTSTSVQSPTYSFTMTFTMTRTSTATFTETHTYTITASNTRTLTVTATGTQPPTWTNTNTPSSTNTLIVSPTFTATMTASNTNTPTPTPTPTYTALLIVTESNTATSTNTESFTPTATNTQQITTTFTPTRTATASLTFANTATSTFTLTLTMTPTAQPTNILEEKEEMKDILIYPQPYNEKQGELIIRFKVNMKFTGYSVSIYTTGFRKIKELKGKGNWLSGENEIKIGKDLKGIAKGVYYFIIEIKNNEKKVTSRISKIIIY